MNTYLTQSDISELKAIKALYVNDTDLSDLKKFLKQDNKEVTTVRNDNMDNTWFIIFDYFTSKFSEKPESVMFRKLYPDIQNANEKGYIVERDLSKLSPKLFKLLETAKNTNFVGAVEKVNEKLSEIFKDGGFDATKFILNTDFDFKPFTVDNVDKKIIDNTVAIDKAVSKFFESFATGLNAEQKTILSKNLFNTVNFFVTNSTHTTVKEKGNDFKNLIEYVNSQSI